jgi:hypothetical protein
MERNPFSRERSGRALKDFGCDADNLVIFFMYLSEISE